MLLYKKDFVAELATRCEITKTQAAEEFDRVFTVLGDLLYEGNDVAVPNVGKFEIKERNERTGRNPATGEAIVIPARKVVTFKAGKVLKDAVAVL